ncbi:cryptococcal mannosyltransferase 1-domain-containing protein [Rhodofomes roseus]|uniref:Cryptococcal mannosyltransferase 1-domain-containing protein n=1 Tax=Rhodofomes roseus TaxID=34475 RepID=A0ABQ8KQS0_9APHY|nr:cryptococcal mannosyltransferase 1-domain-containing protein [Rhodofomes roseus]KAH9840707.1 cryptococcal mannosyltransferase 1-domain-containing protein [Rhodofomes roseus]
MAFYFRRRSLIRILLFVILCTVVKLVFFPSSTSTASDSREIRKQNVLDLVARSDKPLDARRHKFLQVRLGRDDREDLFHDMIKDGVLDYWERFQKPYIVGHDTAHMDEQSVLSAIEQLLTLNGWVAALCPTLTRPFGQNRHDDAYTELVGQEQLYFIGMVIHSADHFLVDQLAVIVQLARRLGSSNIFVSMLDYDSSDSTATLTDLCEAVLTLLGVPFRIRRVPGMTEDPIAAYYPLEEAYTRNLVLEPLHELYERRAIKFHRVIWLKGFTCPNDILETIKLSIANEAAMVCGMDWAEFNGFFIFSDRWRTRDINGDQFRQSKSSSISNSPLTSVPPRDVVGAQRYTQHLPFQVFCCESGTHVVDPAQSYYAGIAYRAGADFHNASTPVDAPHRLPDDKCLDSTQAWFCRDLWIHKAREGLRALSADSENEGVSESVVAGAEVRHHANGAQHHKRAPQQQEGGEPADDGDDARGPAAAQDEIHEEVRQPADADPDANAGSDYDASDLPLEAPPPPPPEYGAGDMQMSIPNSVFLPARIMVNPRCVTTYAGVAHTQLALDLFGPPDREERSEDMWSKDVLEKWETAPETFVCQEQQRTGGRRAQKTQRRLAFSVHKELEELLS